MGATNNRLAGVKPPPAALPGCKVGRFRSSLSDRERETLDAMLADRALWRHTAIEDVVGQALGVVISAKAIGTHRNGRCACRS